MRRLAAPAGDLDAGGNDLEPRPRPDCTARPICTCCAIGLADHAEALYRGRSPVIRHRTADVSRAPRVKTAVVSNIASEPALDRRPMDEFVLSFEVGAIKPTGIFARCRLGVR